MRHRIPITERLAKLAFAPPSPSEEFRARTLRYIQEADDFCREEMGLPHAPVGVPVEPEPVEAPLPPPIPPTPPSQLVRVSSSRPPLTRGCAGCGGDLDAHNPDCHNCHMRHYMRTICKVDKLCEMIRRAFP